MKSSLVGEAFERFHAQDWDQAEILLRRAVESEPEALEPRVHLANLLRLRNHLDEAVSILEPLENEPGVGPACRWLLFEARCSAGDFSEACRLADRFGDDPDLGSEHRQEIINCARQAGNWSLALRFSHLEGDRRLVSELRWIVFIRRVLKALPAVLRRHFVRFSVRWFERRGRWRAARAVLEAAASADPCESAWPRLLGQLCRRVRDVYAPHWEQERNWHQTALRINPHDREAEAGLLQTLFDMRRWSDALERIERAVPENASRRLPLLKAACCSNLGRREEADRIYCELRSGPGTAFARFCRSLIALEEQRWDDARRLLVYKTDEKGLGVLVDFFRRVSRLLSSGRSAGEIDGQELLDDMMGVSAAAGFSHDKRSPSEAGSERGVTCNLCEWQGPRVMLWQDRTTGWLRARCPRCSMISVNPLPPPQDIRELYTHEERENLSVIRIYRKALLDVMDASREACRQLPTYKEVTEWGEDFCWDDFEKAIGEEKRCVDVGCSAGRAVEMFRRCGWQAEGIDVDPQAVAFARSKGVNVSLGRLETLERTSPHYHLITLIDVIEHVEDPISVVRRCMEILYPGGLLYVKTPASDSLPHRFLGDCWLDSAEHLQFFSRRTLQRLLVESGFQIVSLRQRMEFPTPFLHRELWQEQLYPELLLTWIDRLRAGDVVMFLARKPS